MRRTRPSAAAQTAYFTELNRERPPADLLDLISYSLSIRRYTPLTTRRLMETPPAQAVTLSSARQFCDEKALVISPITPAPTIQPQRHRRGRAPLAWRDAA